MLRRGIADTGLMVVIRLVMLGVILLLCFVVATKLYGAIIGPERDDVKQLALRSEYLVNGAYSVAETEAGEERYMSNVFLVTGSTEQALVVLGPEEDGTKDGFSVDWGGATRTFVNPYDEAAICEVPLTEGRGVRKRDCAKLNVEDVELVRIRSEREERAVGYTHHEEFRSGAELYPTLPEGEYARVFIPYEENHGEEGDIAQVLLYVEHFPGYTHDGENVPSTLLITPHAEDISERASKLTLCRAWQDDTCAYRYHDAPVENSYCRPAAEGCQMIEAPQCPHGPVLSPCSCGGTAYDEGICAIDAMTGAQQWYDAEAIDCRAIRTSQSCEEYCPDGNCDVAGAHACVLDICGLRAHCQARVGQTCTESAFGASTLRLAELSRMLIGVGEGYRFAMVSDVYARGNPVVGWDADTTFLCNATGPGCAMQLARAQETGSAAGLPNVVQFGAYEDGALLCRVDIRPDRTLTNPLTWFSAGDGYIFTDVSERIHACAIFGEDVVLIGDSETGIVEVPQGIFPGEPDARYLPGVHLGDCSSGKNLQSISVIEVLVREEHPPLVRITCWDEDTPLVSERLGLCSGEECPPSSRGMAVDMLEVPSELDVRRVPPAVARPERIPGLD